MPRIRLGDKFNRFKNLTRSGLRQVVDESIRDTLIDLANYAILTVMEIDNAKPQPFPLGEWLDAETPLAKEKKGA